VSFVRTSFALTRSRSRAIAKIGENDLLERGLDHLPCRIDDRLLGADEDGSLATGGDR
jgi:hypothetical protein